VVTITLSSGRLKRDIIEMMREMCGEAGFTFGATAEEEKSDLRQLDSMMTEWPWSETTYNFPTSVAVSLPTDECGLAEVDVPAVVASLALRRVPMLGKSLGPEAASQIARSYQSVCSRYATMPTMPLAPHTPRGSGFPGYPMTTVFITETTDEE